MGLVRVDIQVANPKDSERTETLRNVLVDTGAAHSVLPASLLEHLRIEPVQTRSVILGDLRDVEWGIGMAQFHIFNETWPCPVYFGPEDQYLIGATTLETFGLMVDSEAEVLTPRIIRARPL